MTRFCNKDTLCEAHSRASRYLLPELSDRTRLFRTGRGVGQEEEETAKMFETFPKNT